jgi:starch phosphorylase
LDDLQQLEPLADDAGFREEWRSIKQAVKRDLASRIHKQFGILVDPASLFDVQVKRIHEYKRQHLNALHIVTLYSQLKQNPNLEITPRTFIFGGKAAPGYHMAKLMIKLITAVGDMVNKDPDLRNQLRVIFLPNYNVTNSQRIYPASDLSEQISTAGFEASGTGNMKFAMNGALTIGTLDGANIEIRDAVGAENFFLFGLTADQVGDSKPRATIPGLLPEQSPAQGCHRPDCLRPFLPGRWDLFKPLLDKLLYHDPFLLLADYQAYVDCQQAVSRPIKTPTTGPACPFSTRCAWDTFHRIAQFANTAKTSGRCRPSAKEPELTYRRYPKRTANVTPLTLRDNLA